MITDETAAEIAVGKSTDPASARVSRIERGPAGSFGWLKDHPVLGLDAELAVVSLTVDGPWQGIGMKASMAPLSDPQRLESAVEDSGHRDSFVVFLEAETGRVLLVMG